MKVFLETRRDSLVISTDPARLDLDAVCDFLARAFWAQDRPRDRIEQSLRNSLVFGVYDGPRQVGLARVVTDYATFAWLCDVFIHEDYRGKGIGKWLMRTIVTHVEFQGLRRILLVTRDAHGLYSQFGFSPLRLRSFGWNERARERIPVAVCTDRREKGEQELHI